MRREVRQLRQKAVDSFVLSIEHFNRPSNRGRTEAVLILLDRAFELLLKAVICHRGGKIRRPRERNTIGFEACVRKGLTDGEVKFLAEEQAILLRAINGQRDAAQHYLIDLAERQLYFYIQSGVTVFRDIYDGSFDDKLLLELPERVLPVSTTAPVDLAMMFDADCEEIRTLLAPGRRRKSEAITKARSLAILERVIVGKDALPGDRDLARICERLVSGEDWESIFPGVSSLRFSDDRDGMVVNLRLTKKDGIPVRLMPDGDSDVSPLAVKRVNELDYYSLGARELAAKLNLTIPKALAVVNSLNLQDDEMHFKEFRIGSVKHRRYSAKALDRMRAALAVDSIDQFWAREKERKRLAIEKKKKGSGR